MFEAESSNALRKGVLKMAQIPYADPIDGILTIDNSLIIYNGGYYSLDGGTTVSSDTIGPDTQISSPTATAVTITLQNTETVNAKRISAARGTLTITGTGTIRLDNQDVAELSRRSGVRSSGNAVITGGAKVYAVGFNDGFYVTGLTNNLVVSQNSYLYGECTGTNSSIIGAAKYGVNCGGSIIAETGGRIEGVGTADSYNTYGVFCDASHSMTTALQVSSGSTVSGSASVGVYTGGPTVVDGSLTGTGGALSTSHGIQGDRAGITVNTGGTVSAVAQAGAYAGIIMVYGYEINGGSLTGTGGRYGVRSASSGAVTVTDGILSGTGSDQAGSYGVFVENSGLTAVNSHVRGEGNRTGIYAGGTISATTSTVEGYTYAYGRDTEGYYGAIISGDVIQAQTVSRIIENYSRTEYFDEAYQIPYKNGKNMTDYRNYLWFISSGTGEVESSPDGQGIHAVQAGEGILTAVRNRPLDTEVVELGTESSHTIHIPVELSIAPTPEFSVTYDGNGADGGMVPTDENNPYHENDEVTVLGNVGNLTRTGYRFLGWNTSADGSGTFYQEGDTLRMPASNLTLYAQWEEIPDVSYTVTYDGNGETCGTVPIDRDNPYRPGETVTVLGNTGNLIKKCYCFAGWTLNPDGVGLRYREGDSFSMPSENVILYALWIPAGQSCCRPCPTSCCDPCQTPCCGPCPPSCW